MGETAMKAFGFFIEAFVIISMAERAVARMRGEVPVDKEG
jgi:hypothetical protein